MASTQFIKKLWLHNLQNSEHFTLKMLIQLEYKITFIIPSVLQGHMFRHVKDYRNPIQPKLTNHLKIMCRYF